MREWMLEWTNRLARRNWMNVADFFRTIKHFPARTDNEKLTLSFRIDDNEIFRLLHNRLRGSEKMWRLIAQIKTLSSVCSAIAECWTWMNFAIVASRKTVNKIWTEQFWSKRYCVIDTLCYAFWLTNYAWRLDNGLSCVTTVETIHVPSPIGWILESKQLIIFNVLITFLYAADFAHNVLTVRFEMWIAWITILSIMNAEKCVLDANRIHLILQMFIAFKGPPTAF